MTVSEYNNIVGQLKKILTETPIATDLPGRVLLPTHLPRFMATPPADKAGGADLKMQQDNLVYALKQGIIDFGTYLKLWRELA